MKLSILIPTLPKRQVMLENLLRCLSRQMPAGNNRGGVEIITDTSETDTTGAKRNRLLNLARGEYIVFVDDDDEVPEYYLEEILKAIEQGPDVISFNGYMTTDGGGRKNFVIRKDENYEERDNVYYRYCNHLCPVKRQLAIQIGFPDKTIYEDYEYATSLRNSGLLKTEVVIEKDMYHYKFLNKK